MPPKCFLLLGLALFAPGASNAAPAPNLLCENLAALKLPHTTVTIARYVPAGTFNPPTGEELPASSDFKNAPAFCRIRAELQPSSDSHIQVEVWMPASGWDGKYQGQGNGGFAGSIDFTGMARAVSRGDAASGTDTGHEGGGTDATWALGHPEKVVDFGYRAIHETAETAKAVIKAFYGQAPRHSYFASCSDGGREALMEAQRFPGDYDGIVAGAPANFWTRLLSEAAYNAQATLNDPASYIPAAKLPAISAGVLAACDAQDGLKDGLLNDPRQCHFDPATLNCKGIESASCLTSPEITALRKIYAGARDSKDRQIFPGYEPGGEEGPGGWAAWITGPAPGRSLLFAFGTHYFADMVYANAAWDFRTFDLDKGLQLADQKTARILNATDSNLEPFRSRGGKLILYHGWSDAAIPPVNTINYYESVRAAMGTDATNSFVRLFMAPGMQHCYGGPGPSLFGQELSRTAGDPQHDIDTALDLWVEKGVAPEKIIATKYVNNSKPAQGIEMTRPLCPYPQIAKYRGTGDTNDAANFVCADGVR